MKNQANKKMTIGSKQSSAGASRAASTTNPGSMTNSSQQVTVVQNQPVNQAQLNNSSNAYKNINVIQMNNGGKTNAVIQQQQQHHHHTFHHKHTVSDINRLIPSTAQTIASRGGAVHQQQQQPAPQLTSQNIDTTPKLASQSKVISSGAAVKKKHNVVHARTKSDTYANIIGIGQYAVQQQKGKVGKILKNNFLEVQQQQQQVVATQGNQQQQTTATNANQQHLRTYGVDPQSISLQMISAAHNSNQNRKKIIQSTFQAKPSQKQQLHQSQINQNQQVDGSKKTTKEKYQELKGLYKDLLERHQALEASMEPDSQTHTPSEQIHHQQQLLTQQQKPSQKGQLNKRIKRFVSGSFQENHNNNNNINITSASNLIIDGDDYELSSNGLITTSGYSQPPQGYLNNQGQNPSITNLQQAIQQNAHEPVVKLNFYKDEAASSMQESQKPSHIIIHNNLMTQSSQSNGTQQQAMQQGKYPINVNNNSKQTSQLQQQQQKSSRLQRTPNSNRQTTKKGASSKVQQITSAGNTQMQPPNVNMELVRKSQDSGSGLINNNKRTISNNKRTATHKRSVSDGNDTLFKFNPSSQQRAQDLMSHNHNQQQASNTIKKTYQDHHEAKTHGRMQANANKGSRHPSQKASSQTRCQGQGSSYSQTYHNRLKSDDLTKKRINAQGQKLQQQKMLTEAVDHEEKIVAPNNEYILKGFLSDMHQSKGLVPPQNHQAAMVIQENSPGNMINLTNPSHTDCIMTTDQTATDSQVYYHQRNQTNNGLTSSQQFHDDVPMLQTSQKGHTDDHNHHYKATKYSGHPEQQSQPQQQKIRSVNKSIQKASARKYLGGGAQTSNTQGQLVNNHPINASKKQSSNNGNINHPVGHIRKLSDGSSKQPQQQQQINSSKVSPLLCNEQKLIKALQISQGQKQQSQHQVHMSQGYQQILQLAKNQLNISGTHKRVKSDITNSSDLNHIIKAVSQKPSKVNSSNQRSYKNIANLPANSGNHTKKGSTKQSSINSHKVSMNQMAVSISPRVTQKNNKLQNFVQNQKKQQEKLKHSQVQNSQMFFQGDNQLDGGRKNQHGQNETKMVNVSVDLINESYNGELKPEDLENSIDNYKYSGGQWYEVEECKMEKQLREQMCIQDQESQQHFVAVTAPPVNTVKASQQAVQMNIMDEQEVDVTQDHGKFRLENCQKLLKRAKDTYQKQRDSQDNIVNNADVQKNKKKLNIQIDRHEPLEQDIVPKAEGKVQINMKISPRLLAANKNNIVNKFKDDGIKQQVASNFVEDFNVIHNQINMGSEQSKEMFAPLNSMNASSNRAVSKNDDISGNKLLAPASERLETQDSIANDPKITPRTKAARKIKKHIQKSFKQTGQPPNTTVDFYRIGKVLGKGAFGKVNLAVHQLTEVFTAIKSINKTYFSDESQSKKVMQEVLILRRTRHRNIVRLYEYFETSKHILFVIELCAGGDLLNYVRKRRQLKEDVAKSVFKQIIDGLSYCHSKNILHRDIKLDNILLSSNGEIKICDFGVSKIVKKGEVMTEQCGTPAYIAPEILLDRGYTGFAVDIWSAGVVLYAMIFGTVPFKANNMSELQKMIIKAKYSLGEGISKDGKDILKGLLEKDPKKRLTIPQILKHPWMKDAKDFVDLFTQAEKNFIQGEYTYNDTARYNRNEHDFFVDQMLDTTQNSILKNADTKSVILAPFNSTKSNLDESFSLSDSIKELIQSKGCLKFAARVREIDKQYEVNNNAELDNGVYHDFGKEDENKDKDQKDGDGKDNNSDSSLSNDASNQSGDEESKQANKKGKKAKQTELEKLEKAVLKADGDNQENIYEEQMLTNESQDAANFMTASLNSYTAKNLFPNDKTLILEEAIVQKIVDFGYRKDLLTRYLNNNDLNYATTSYYLLFKEQENKQRREEIQNLKQ